MCLLVFVSSLIFSVHGSMNKVKELVPEDIINLIQDGGNLGLHYIEILIFFYSLVAILQAH